MYRLTAICTALFLAISAGLSADPIHDAVTAGDVSAVGRLLGQNPLLVSSPDTALNLPLHLAASAGQVAVIELLLASGADIEAGDRENTTALTTAAMLNKPEAVRLLVEKGASVGARDSNGNTPLLSAARNGDLELIKYLMDHGASLTEVSGRGSNCLHIAASIGAVPLVQYLLDQGMDKDAPNGSGYTPMEFAAMAGFPGVIRLLHTVGADPDKIDGTGHTALIQAVLSSRMESIATLVELGADVNLCSTDAHDQSPLSAAIWGGSVEIFDYLIEHGADLQKRNQEGESLLHVAAAKGDTAIARVLVARGFDVNEPARSGMVPLCLAAWGQPVMIQWLIDQGARVNGATENAGQPLNYAAITGNAEIVRTLLAQGATVDYRSEIFDASLYSAVQNGDSTIVQTLLEAGADPNLVSVAAHQTPLHCAARNGQSELVMMLLDHGAKVDPIDSLSRTPLYYAARYGHISVEAALTDRGAKLSGIVEQSRTPIALSEPTPAGEAAVWYLGHSGWAVKTQNHFPVFDYWQSGVQPDEPCLVNGYVVPSEIDDLPVTVFSTHEHADHYDTAIFQWRDQVPTINYVFGHRPRDRQGYEYVGPGESKDLAGMKVSAIRATDAGVGFIVEVDGLTIFHAGDHAAGQVGLSDAFTSEIDRVAERCSKIDLAFLPVSGCSLGTLESVRAGDFYILTKLHPKVVFPQHALNGEPAYFEFKREAARAGFTEKVECAEHRGDMFRYGGSPKL